MNEDTANNLSLTSSFEEEIFNKSFDLSVDYSEIAIDLITTSEVIKEIPWVKTLVAFYNITSSINARFNIKKNLVFLQRFHLRQIDLKKLEEFKHKLNNDSKYKNEILETTLVLIEKFADIEKAKILANLLISHIEENLTWEDFRKLSFILNNLNPFGYIFLEKTCNQNSYSMSMSKVIEGEAFLLACGIGTKFEDIFRLTKTGQQLYDFGLKPLKNKDCPNS